MRQEKECHLCRRYFSTFYTFRQGKNHIGFSFHLRLKFHDQRRGVAILNIPELEARFKPSQFFHGDLPSREQAVVSHMWFSTPRVKCCKIHFVTLLFTWNKTMGLDLNFEMTFKYNGPSSLGLCVFNDTLYDSWGPDQQWMLVGFPCFSTSLIPSLYTRSHSFLPLKQRYWLQSAINVANYESDLCHFESNLL